MSSVFNAIVSVRVHRDGGWREVMLATFHTREDAAKAVAWHDAKYSMLADFPAGSVKERVVQDSFEEFERAEADKTAERALNKLSQAEREVLRQRGVLNDVYQGIAPAMGGQRA